MMITTNYFFEVSIGFGIFYLLYFLLFRKDTFFKRNRFYLLGSAVLSLVIPLLDFSQYQAPVTLPVRMLEPVIIGTQENISPSLLEYLYPFTISVYCFFAFLMLVRFVLSIKKITNYIKEKKTIVKNNYHLINTEGERPTASFMNYLFWDNSVKLQPQDAHKILQHELTHIKDKHSYDLLFMEILQIVFWFLPLVYLYKKELQKQHEFIADASVMTSSAGNSYTQLIVQRLFTELNLNLVHSFNNSSLIKNRIAMLKRTKTPNFLKFKTLLAVPVAAILLMTYACDDTLIEKEEIIIKENVPLNADGTTKTMTVNASGDENEIIDLEFIDEDGEVHELHHFPNSEENNFSFEGDEGESVTIERIDGKHKITINRDDTHTATNERIELHTATEGEMAIPVGGMAAFYGYVGEQLEYPKAAKENGITGKVFVEFTIKADGSISNTKVLKGIGGGCDEAALEIIRNMPKWTPATENGENVSQKMVIPIKFAI